MPGRAPRALGVGLRHYLMCPATYFEVRYAINPGWTHPDRSTRLASGDRPAWSRPIEWLGHRVDLLDPVPGLPDMVYAANGATVIDGVVLTARFANPERTRRPPGTPSGIAQRHRVRGAEVICRPRSMRRRVTSSSCPTRSWPVRLPTTRSAAHAELASLTGRPCSVSSSSTRGSITSTSPSPCSTTSRTTRLLPGRVQAESRRLLAERFPTAILADQADAFAFGLNCVSDGYNVFVPAGALGLRAAIAAPVTAPARSSSVSWRRAAAA